MTAYTPIPGDVIVRGPDSLAISGVYPTHVVAQLTRAGEPYTPVAFDISKFNTKAEGSFAQGAVALRNGVQVYPPPTPTTQPTMTTPLSGSHNVHARLSPSDSKRWVNCTASIAFQDVNRHRLPADRSTYADEGTEAHDWAAKILTSPTPVELPPAFEAVRGYTDAVLAHVPNATLTHLSACLEDAELGLDPPDRAFFVEEQVELFYQPEQTGTADFIAIEAENGVVTRVFGDDYKHGAGVLVEAQESTQLAIYVFSAITMLEKAYKFSPETVVELRIHQPRHREAADQKPWTITLADLTTFCGEIAARAAAAQTCVDLVREAIGSTGRDVGCDEITSAVPIAVFSPSEGDSGACRWCKCKSFCDARLAANTEGLDTHNLSAAEVLAAMPDLGKDMSKLPVEERLGAVSEILGSRGQIITDSYLVNVLARKKAIVAFLNDVEEYLESRLLAGEEIPGAKLVEGREGNRDWANEAEAETFLRGQGLKQDERFDYKLKSPAAIEKILKENLKNTRTRNRFEELIVRSPAQKKVAVESDKRQAVAPAVAAMPDLGDDFEV